MSPHNSRLSFSKVMMVINSSICEINHSQTGAVLMYCHLNQQGLDLKFPNYTELPCTILHKLIPHNLLISLIQLVKHSCKVRWNLLKGLILLSHCFLRFLCHRAEQHEPMLYLALTQSFVAYPRFQKASGVSKGYRSSFFSNIFLNVFNSIIVASFLSNKFFIN